jgi:hypothetical protein
VILKNRAIILIVTSFFLLLTGCARFTIADVDRLEALTRASGYFLGYIVGERADAALEARVAKYYEQIKADGLSIDLVNAGLLFVAEELEINPGLVAELTSTMGQLGVEFDVNGQVVNLNQIPARYLEAGARGYRNGIIAGKWDKEH